MELIKPEPRVRRIGNRQEWEEALQAETQDPEELFLILRPGLTLGPRDQRLLVQALSRLSAKSVVVARVFAQDCPWKVLGHGYWKSPQDFLWRQIAIADEVEETDEPILETMVFPALGAVLLHRRDAANISFFDPLLTTRLTDVDWVEKLRMSGVAVVVVRNARVYADPMEYSVSLGNRYLVVRDDLLMGRHRRWGWPLALPKHFLSLIRNTWRPTDFSIPKGKAVFNPKSWIWAFDEYRRNLAGRMRSDDSRQTLSALRDFLIQRPQ